ncbi:endothelial cell-selective adhesion molecule isoform X2 [Gracilinanus agilis]|uniref:endothelial cell-selective adhesion molecule isoform X2 n=1 Tax=Gracilinanus agilis TaxID=191870 RepID=UPI001CFCCB4B|nr:endothelial cell-selective adhesion molecule isoform X2 [Gracilinanus agilis]
MVPPPGPPWSRQLQLFLLGMTTLATVSRAQLVVHEGSLRVEAVEGAEVVLPAWYTLTGMKPSLKPEPPPYVLWFLEQSGKEMEQVLSYLNGVLLSKPRISLVHSMPSRNVSLRIVQLQEQDSGLYRCSVNVPDQGKSMSDVGSLELDVLVSPAAPSCHLHGVPRMGANVTLSCLTTRSKPAAQYSWERLPPRAQFFFSPAVDSIRGSLFLTNLSASMSGVYVCKASNKVGSAQCNVTLEVTSGPKAAVVAGAVVVTLVVLVLLAIFVLLYCHREKMQEESANDIKEDAVAPRTLPWPKGSDTISKNGTLSSVTSARALRPPHGPPRSGALTPTPSLSSQALSSPGLPRTNRTQPPTASPALGGVSSSALSRMGAVPVMVPAQSQAGSLV